MDTKTIIIKDYVKLTCKGTAYKRQPVQPSIKFEKLLNRQKITFKKTIKRYSDIKNLDINLTSCLSYVNGLFNDTVNPETLCYVFEY